MIFMPQSLFDSLRLILCATSLDFSVMKIASFPLKDDMSSNFLSVLKQSSQGGRVKAYGH